MIATQGAESLDWEYLEHWAKQLDVKQQLDQVRNSSLISGLFTIMDRRPSRREARQDLVH